MQINTFANRGWRSYVLVVHEWRNGSGLGSQWTSATLANTPHSTPRRTPDVHQKTFGAWIGKGSPYPTACAQDDPRHDTEEYTANLNAWLDRPASMKQLEDAYICGLPSIHPFEGLLRHLSIWHGQLEAVIWNLDCLQRGYAKLKQSICLSWSLFPQTNTPATTQVPDTSMPMDIDKHRPETCSCYNCNEKGISHDTAWSLRAPGPVDQIDIGDLKSLVAKAEWQLWCMKRSRRSRRT